MEKHFRIMRDTKNVYRTTKVALSNILIEAP